MVILITGATHTGKTKLAQRLLEQLGYPYFSIDHLKMGLIRSGNTNLTLEDDDALTAYLWPIVREIAKTAIENGQNLTIEGCYIPFDWREDFDETYLLSIRYVCLAMTEAYIDTHFDEITAHALDIEHRLDDGYCTATLLKKENRKYIEGCEQAVNPMVLITDNYEQALERIPDFLA